MDDRLRALEIQHSALDAVVSTSKWWAGAAALLLIGTLGYTNFYSIPAAASKAAEAEAQRLTTQKLRAEIAKLQDITKTAQNVIVEQQETTAAFVGEFTKNLNAGQIQLTSQCVQRTANGCKPPPPANCPADFSDTGLILSSVVPGGSCGYGPICRICGRLRSAPLNRPGS
jgi:hypothetical protein